MPAAAVAGAAAGAAVGAAAGAAAGAVASPSSCRGEGGAELEGRRTSILSISSRLKPRSDERCATLIVSFSALPGVGMAGGQLGGRPEVRRTPAPLCRPLPDGLGDVKCTSELKWGATSREWQGVGRQYPYSLRAWLYSCRPIPLYDKSRMGRRTLVHSSLTNMGKTAIWVHTKRGKFGKRTDTRTSACRRSGAKGRTTKQHASQHGRAGERGAVPRVPREDHRLRSRHPRGSLLHGRHDWRGPLLQGLRWGERVCRRNSQPQRALAWARVRSS